MSSQDQFAQPAIYAGAKAPEGVEIAIVPGGSGVDLTTVMDVTLRVHNGIGDDVLWDTTILSQRWDRLVVRHTFDSDGVDTRTPGRYRLIPELTVPDGVRRTGAFYLAIMP